MSKSFIIVIVGLGMILVLSGIVIFTSFNDGQEALYQYEILEEKTAEIRENADVGGVPEVDPESDSDLPVDYTDMTPGLQQFLREGKPNPEITVDRVR